MYNSSLPNITKLVPQKGSFNQTRETREKNEQIPYLSKIVQVKVSGVDTSSVFIFTLCSSSSIFVLIHVVVVVEVYLYYPITVLQ